jgi:hypothetical protein
MVTKCTSKCSGIDLDRLKETHGHKGGPSKASADPLPAVGVNKSKNISGSSSGVNEKKNGADMDMCGSVIYIASIESRAKRADFL